MELLQIITGIHTYTVFMVLTAESYYRIKEAFSGSWHSTGTDYWGKKERRRIDDLESQGIKLYLSRRQTLYLLKVRLEPCRIPDGKNPAALYRPAGKSYRHLAKRVDDLLKPYGIPKSINEMKLCREDITCDLYFETGEIAEEYMRILQKGLLLPQYKRDWFREKEKKAKDPKAANQHSYRQKCKSAAFFAYDKIAQLQMIDRFPDTLAGRHILRLEAELKREALKKRIGKQNDNYHYLKAGAQQSEKVVRWYLRRIFKGCIGDHLRFQQAISRIDAAHWSDKAKTRATFFIRKISDGKSINAAIDKTRKKFHLSAGQVDRLLRKLNKLGISPITLTNASKRENLESLLAVLENRDSS